MQAKERTPCILSVRVEDARPAGCGAPISVLFLSFPVALSVGTNSIFAGFVPPVLAPRVAAAPRRGYHIATKAELVGRVPFGAVGPSE